MKSIEVDSFEDFDRLLAEPNDFLAKEELEIKGDFSFLENITIVVRDEKYSSSITTSIMKGLLALQERIDYLYKYQKYGNTKKRLSEKEKQEIELVVKVDKGSSSYQILLEGIRVVFQSMDGNKALIGLGIIVTSFLGVNAMRIYAKFKNRQLEREQDSNKLNFLQEVTKTSLNVIKEIVKGNPSSFEINGISYPKEKLKEIVRQDKSRNGYEPHILSGDFLITHIEIDHKRPSYLNAVFLGGEEQELFKKIKIRKNEVESNDFEMIKNLNRNSTVAMQIILKMNEEGKTKEPYFDKLV